MPGSRGGSHAGAAAGICYRVPVIYLAIGVLSVLMSLNEPAAVSKPATATAVESATVSSATEQAYEKLLADDNAAQEEADKWIKEAQAFRAQGVRFSEEALAARIEQRFAPIQKGYEDFLRAHPDHVDARLAYGSFLYETLDEDRGVEQWEKARQLAPSNPATWNNLANHFGHRGPVSKAFEYYGKAIELSPEEPVYLQNLATTTYVFRKDAMEFYKINEKEVFDRSLDLYRKALKLDPNNFPLATDYAQSFYGIKPLRTQDALAAWNDALKVANDDFERQGVFVHLARVELNSGMFDDARKHLAMVTNNFYDVLRNRLTRNLAEKEKAMASPPVQPKETPPSETATTPSRRLDLFSIPHRSPKPTAPAK